MKERSDTFQEGRDAGIIVIGAGAGGMMAAGRAAEMGAKVLLLEKTEHHGKKLLISGKTRCNLTNAKSIEHFLSMYGANGTFLRQAFHRFFRDDLISLLKQYGVETKTERGGRVFPLSDNARDVVAALTQYVAHGKVTIKRECAVGKVLVSDGRIAGTSTNQGKFYSPAVIIATGGSSYPQTGSSGDGYKMAASLGHQIRALRPALVPLVVEERQIAKSMQGTSLRNVRLTAFRGRAESVDVSLTPSEDRGRGCGKKPVAPVIESRFGEMMITHFGIGGPVTLLMSLAVVDALSLGPVGVSIDLKPALTEEQLRRRLQRDFDSFGKRGLQRLLAGLVPQKMVGPLASLTGIPADTPAHQITAAQRDRLAALLKSLRFNILRPLSLEAAIVTAGGVSLKEVDPRTMASRIVPGLFFCGEVLDIDADTGGYNLQAAFSTGRLAGEKAAEYILSQRQAREN